MAPDISAAFPPALDTPDHVKLAEDLGYQRAWLYDSPAYLHDVWMTLARAAERTQRIGLGPAVLVPSLRHPMTNAAAIATLEELAPGRVAVAVGSGFTGRHMLGLRPLPWADVGEYVKTLRALLAGEEAQWDGRTIKMIHPPGFGAARPIDVPILVGAEGPKGMAVAEEHGDGTFSATGPNTATRHDWRAILRFGTVLGDGEEPSSPRVVEAAGPGTVVIIHALYEQAGAGGVDNLPGGAQWRGAIEAIDERTRHLAVHEGHLVHLTDRDRAALEAGLASLIPTFGLTGPADQVREKVDELADQGVTEIAYQPSRHDTARDLQALADALNLTGPAQRT
jgi:5,10-methylenetetrahydromethanopterin reductase